MWSSSVSDKERGSATAIAPRPDPRCAGPRFAYQPGRRRGCNARSPNAPARAVDGCRMRSIRSLRQLVRRSYAGKEGQMALTPDRPLPRPAALVSTYPNRFVLPRRAWDQHGDHSIDRRNPTPRRGDCKRHERRLATPDPTEELRARGTHPALPSCFCPGPDDSCRSRRGCVAESVRGLQVLGRKPAAMGPHAPGSHLTRRILRREDPMLWCRCGWVSYQQPDSRPPALCAVALARGGGRGNPSSRPGD